MTNSSNKLTKNLFTGALFITLIYCVHAQTTTSVAPAPKSPYVILTSNKSLVHNGDTVQFTVTFANPTSKNIRLPHISDTKNQDAFVEIAHKLVVTRNGIESPIHSSYISSSPSSFQHLEPGTQKTYKFKWISSYTGKGIAHLKFIFSSDLAHNFPPVTITLKTE